MSKIRVMDEVLANKIAAGEVVEKCMNVVKELVENAIDAKSTVIKIELEDSGVKKIKVTDNGIGMDKEDAVLAFSRHATSKLKAVDDLFNIDSLGFRGEALPSIASVSHVTLKTSDGVSGTEVIIDGGKILSVAPCDLREGTSIVVEDLFYNTPVRLKYLKSLYTELAYISEYVDKMALSFPNIKFVLTNNEKTLLNTDGSGRLLKVIHDIYGLAVTKKMIEVQGENNDYEIHGYISYPEVMKSNKNAITTLVNGRVIKNHELIRMITDSYHTYIPPDKYPIIVLQIEVDPALIDVNIHPTKMDIKFSKMDTLKELVTQIITEQLEKLTLIPDASLETKIESSGKTTISTNYAPVSTQEFDAEKKEEEFQEFEKMKLDFEAKESPTTYPSSASADEVDSSFNLTEEKQAVSKERIKKMYPVGLVHGTYIIAENEDGMFIIDQHAANERINYEYYLRELSNPERVVTDLLVPITLEFPTNEYLILKQNFSLLDKIGFGYEEFGFQTIVIRSLPVWLTKAKTEQAVRQIIDIIITQEDFQMEKFLHHIAATVACKASIKANDHIMQKDMEVLLERLRDCENPFTCPHGRPTIITYSKYDLEKLFKRAM
ncbi:MAG TPA: DNA mismatch repair endonuclease MutL [Candidatus Scybalousia intestinigallinarum]|nr:DNA mismatch repair endonuclease MutL [Candidatus Scybalousia intestinigallinarum]